MSLSLPILLVITRSSGNVKSVELDKTSHEQDMVIAEVSVDCHIMIQC